MQTEIRYTLRVLGRNPGFTTAAVLSLALGIGANTAIFTLLNALLLRELPVRQPERLVQLSVVRRDEKMAFSYPMFLEFERGQRIASGLIGWSFGNLTNIEVNGVHAQAFVDSVTGNYYSELGVVPLLGRLIAPGDMTSPVAVLGYESWQRRFGGASDVLGKQIRIQGQAFTIIGITRKWFTGMTPGSPPEVTVPIKSNDSRALLWVNITARLKDGVSIGQARAQLQALWPAVQVVTCPTETPGLRRRSFFSMRLDVAPAASGVARGLRAQFTRPLYLLMGIVGLILLLACVNLANLMLARAAARSHELSVRVALGAGRRALAGQVFTESLVLSTSGALLGLAFAYWASRLLVRFMIQGRITLDLRPDWRVLLLTAAVAVLTAILVGAAPAWRGWCEDPASVLQRGARTMGGVTGKTGKALMVIQVALSLVLLLGAGLLVRSFRNLCTVETGFEERVLEVILNARPGGYRNLDLYSYRHQLIERTSGLPGVASVAFAAYAGPGYKGWQETVSTMAAALSPDSGVMADSLAVSPGFLRTLGIRLVLGRDLDWTDDERHARVAIISSSLAAWIFPGGNAIGQRIRFGFMPEFQDLEVVGVASTARLFDPRDSVARVIYLPCLQYSTWFERPNLFLRTPNAPEAIARSVGHEIEALGHEYPIRFRTLGQAASEALATERAIALLSGFFALLALLLASIGLYGLASYTVARHSREIGIRTALGAQPAAVRWGVLRGTLALALAGIALGIPCALAISRFIAAMLFGISPTDAPTMAFVCLLLLAVAFLASYPTARRASRIDPMAALRTE